GVGAPARKTRFVAPMRMRKHQALPDLAPEPVDEKHAWVFIELGPQARRDIEIGLIVARPRHHLEEQTNHEDAPSLRGSAGTAPKRSGYRADRRPMCGT